MIIFLTIVSAVIITLLVAKWTNNIWYGYLISLIVIHATYYIHDNLINDIANPLAIIGYIVLTLAIVGSSICAHLYWKFLVNKNQ